MTIEQKAIAAWGAYSPIYGPNLAAWMLKDGTYINGSYEGFRRDIDHREISQFFKPSKRQDPGSSAIYIRKFMRRGNIRVGCSESGHTFELAGPPTQQQFDSICLDIREQAAEKPKAIPISIGRFTGKQPYALWETPWDFISYIDRYTNLYIPPFICEWYYDMTGKELRRANY